MNSRIFTLVHLDDDPLELRRISRLLTSSNQNTSTSTESATADSVDYYFKTEHYDFSVYSFYQTKDFKKFVLQNKAIDFCILDIFLSEDESINGLALIQFVKKNHPECAIIVSSFQDKTDWILKSLSLQADEFFSKKIWPKNLVKTLLQIYAIKQLKAKNTHHFSQKTTYTSLYPNSAGKTLRTIEKRVQNILMSEAKCILIEGESGTGKEVVCDMFEFYGRKINASLPFLRLNCATLSTNLMESELFGHKKGAFTGALDHKIGFIEEAHNGFLFLDEIASLSLNAQSALLRVIENQEIISVGDTKARKINVRFICASNIPIASLVQKNLFRKDLWQRLQEIEINLPNLRERKDEISELIDFFCSQFKEKKYKIDPLAKQVLCTFDWRNGNVRELRNTLRAMTEFAHDNVLHVSSIPERFFRMENENDNIELNEASLSTTMPQMTIQLYTRNQLRSYTEMCDEILLKIIHHHRKNGKVNMSALAKKLGISRSHLHIKMKAYGSSFN